MQVWNGTLTRRRRSPDLWGRGEPVVESAKFAWWIVGDWFHLFRGDLLLLLSSGWGSQRFGLGLSRATCAACCCRVECGMRLLVRPS
jgi:hypothetical protein